MEEGVMVRGALEDAAAWCYPLAAIEILHYVQIRFKTDG